MAHPLMYSPRVNDWLISICGESDSSQPVIHDDSSYNQQSPVYTARKRTCYSTEEGDLHRTPRAKRQATRVDTPFASNIEEYRLPPTFESSTPSLSSTRSRTVSSRSSSPSKRAIEIENEFSKPEIQHYNKWDSKRWVEKEGAGVPLLQELRDMVAAADHLQEELLSTFAGLTVQLEKLLARVGECVKEKAPEDTWSDLVIHPALSLATEVSQNPTAVKILNAKSIDVAPKDLVPMNSLNTSVPAKRVHYTIGLEFASEKITKEVRKRIPQLGHSFNQTIHQMTSHRVLCSHVEIKVIGSAEDGRPQLSTWTAAGFRKLETLWLHRHRHDRPTSSLAMAPIPLWQWKEENISLYIAVMDSANETLHILHEAQYVVETSPTSLLKIILAMAQIMNWGCKHYLPWFKDLIGYAEEKTFEM